MTSDEVLEQVKEKANMVKEMAVQKMNQAADWDLEDKIVDGDDDVKHAAEVDDIVIDYSNDEEA